jgi:hypothetical protein
LTSCGGFSPIGMASRRMNGFLFASVAGAARRLCCS